MNIDGLKKVPMWVWGALVGLLAVAWMWASKSSTPVEEEPTVTVEPIDTPVDGLASYNTVGIMGTNDSRDYQGGISTSTLELTNAQWLAEAVKTVTNSSPYSVVQVQAALQKYLYGEQLTTAQAAIVDIAVRSQGVPPEGVQGIVSVEATKAATPVSDPNAAKKIKDQLSAAQRAKAALQKSSQTALDAAQAAIRAVDKKAGTKTHTISSAGGATLMAVAKTYNRGNTTHEARLLALNEVGYKQKYKKTLTTQTKIPKGYKVVIPKDWKK